MMPSANGYKIEIGGWTGVAVWPAPFFVLVLDDSDDPSEPLLIHCDDRAHAEMNARRGGILLNAKFEAVAV